MSNLCQDGTLVLNYKHAQYLIAICVGDVRASFLSSGGIPIVLKCMADSLPSSEETLVKVCSSC